MRAVPTLLVLALFLGGCAYSKAMHRAEDYAEMGQWRNAVAEYELALAKKPNSEKARAGWDAAIKPAIQEATSDAESKLAAGDYEGVMQQVLYIERYYPQDAGATRLRTGVDQGLAALFESSWSGGQIETAYSAGARARDLLGGTSWSEEALTRSRTYYYDWSQKLTDQANYSDAIGVLSYVRKYEPGWNGETDAREVRIRGLWADTRVALAHKYQKKHQVGAAAAAFGGAYEVARRAEDQAAMRETVAALRSQGWFWMMLDVSGEDWRTGPILNSAVGQVQGQPGVAWANSADAAQLRVVMYPGGTRCEDQSSKSIAQQQYISGYQDIPNPEYGRLVDSIAYGERQVADASSRWQTARSALDAAAQQRDNYAYNVLSPIEQRQREAQSRYDSAKGRWDSTRRMIAEYQSQAPTDTSSQAYLAYTITLGGLQQQEIEEGNAVELIRRELEPLAAEYAAASAEYARYQQSASTAQYSFDTVDQSLRWANESLERDRATLYNTPASFQQPIYDLFPYEVWTITRTCSVGLDIEYRWQNGTVVPRSTGGWAATQDITWNAYPEYGVNGDPLQFPLSDGDLILTADQAAAGDALAGVVATIDEVYRNREADALATAQKSRFDSLDDLLPLYLVVPGRLSPDATQLTINIANEAGGLYNLTTLNE